MKGFPIYAFLIAASAGLSGWALRFAASDPHPVFVGLGVFGVVLALCLVVVSINRSVS